MMKTLDPVPRQSIASALYPSTALHRLDLPPVELSRIDAYIEPPPTIEGDATFCLSTPEARCRTRIDLIFCPDPATGALVADPAHYWGTAVAPINLFDGHTLWLTKRAEAAKHGVGQVNVENLLGDIYAGEAIPQPGCLGHHVEVETCADEIWGRLHVVGWDEQDGPLPDGVWVCRVAHDARYPMSDQEWARVTSRAWLRVLVGAHVSNAGT